MLYEIVIEEAKQRNIEAELASVAIFIDRLDDIVAMQIIEIAKKVKSLKIITNNINSFFRLEEVLYCDFGIAIQVTSNRKKTVSSKDIIIDYDFENIKLDKYEIVYNEELIEEIPNKDQFNKTILYESLIYRKDTYNNIKKQLEKDNVRLYNKKY